MVTNPNTGGKGATGGGINQRGSLEVPGGTRPGEVAGEHGKTEEVSSGVSHVD